MSPEFFNPQKVTFGFCQGCVRAAQEYCASKKEYDISKEKSPRIRCLIDMLDQLIARV